MLHRGPLSMTLSLSLSPPTTLSLFLSPRLPGVGHRGAAWLQ